MSFIPHIYSFIYSFPFSRSLAENEHTYFLDPIFTFFFFFFLATKTMNLKHIVVTKRVSRNRFMFEHQPEGRTKEATVMDGTEKWRGRHIDSPDGAVTDQDWQE